MSKKCALMLGGCGNICCNRHTSHLFFFFTDWYMGMHLSCCIVALTQRWLLEEGSVYRWYLFTFSSNIIEVVISPHCQENLLDARLVQVSCHWNAIFGLSAEMLTTVKCHRGRFYFFSLFHQTVQSTCTEEEWLLRAGNGIALPVGALLVDTSTLSL